MAFQPDFTSSFLLDYTENILHVKDEIKRGQMIYLPIGSVFLLVGLLLFYLQHRKNVRIKQIVENGYYVMAKVDHIIANVIAHITFGAQSRNQAVFLIREINKKFIEKRLVRHGQYVNAVVKSIAIDPGVEYGRAESSISFGVKA